MNIKDLWPYNPAEYKPRGAFDALSIKTHMDKGVMLFIDIHGGVWTADNRFIGHAEEVAHN